MSGIYDGEGGVISGKKNSLHPSSCIIFSVAIYLL